VLVKGKNGIEFVLLVNSNVGAVNEGNIFAGLF